MPRLLQRGGGAAEGGARLRGTGVAAHPAARRRTCSERRARTGAEPCKQVFVAVSPRPSGGPRRARTGSSRQKEPGAPGSLRRLRLRRPQPGTLSSGRGLGAAARLVDPGSPRGQRPGSHQAASDRITRVAVPTPGRGCRCSELPPSSQRSLLGGSATAKESNPPGRGAEVAPEGAGLGSAASCPLRAQRFGAPRAGA